MWGPLKALGVRRPPPPQAFHQSQWNLRGGIGIHNQVIIELHTMLLISYIHICLYVRLYANHQAIPPLAHDFLFYFEGTSCTAKQNFHMCCWTYVVFHELCS